MPTFAAHDQPTHQELERRVREAWGLYNGALRDLTGREYEEAEAKAWDRLQRELASLDAPVG